MPCGSVSDRMIRIFAIVALLWLPQLAAAQQRVADLPVAPHAAAGWYNAAGPSFSLGVTIPLNRTAVSGRSSSTYRQLSSTNGLSRRALLEIGGVILTGAGHLTFSALDASAYFIPLASLAWGGYVYYRARSDPEYLSNVGLTRDALGPALRDASYVAAGSLALMALVGAAQGSLSLRWGMAPGLLLYPTWGLVQQFLVQGLVSRNLNSGPEWLASPYVITPISAALFGLVHAPSWKLAAGTFALGLAYTPLYLKHQNLWPLGLYHGWLGVFYYYWVLGRSPWRSVLN